MSEKDVARCLFETETVADDGSNEMHSLCKKNSAGFVAMKKFIQENFHDESTGIDLMDIEMRRFPDDEDNLYEPWFIVTLNGGLNGPGKWKNYLESIQNLLDVLDDKGRCWVVDLKNDCLDDVFYLRIGIALATMQWMEKQGSFQCVIAQNQR